MAEDFSDKTQKIAVSATKKSGKAKYTPTFPFFSPRRRDVDCEISRTQLIRARKMEAPPGDVHADQAQLRPELPPRDDLYEAGTILGEGGQGIVFRAKDKSLERVVAVKSLRAELLNDAQARKSFLAEAKITAQLEHPSIVPIYSLTGDADGGLHLSMKMLRGMTLATYLDETCRRYREDGIKSYDEAKALRYRLELFLRVCDALSYVHSRNLMHRDLKPGNIIIGEYREVYLIDWGIATPIRNEHPGAEASTLGTPPFMAPEVLSGEAGDQRSDIFALGVILFDVVFLHAAFPGETPQELIAKVKNGECAPFCHAFRSGVSRELAAIVKKAMATSPEARYQTVEELSRDLRNFLLNEETTALPDNFFGKISRAMAKHRKFVAGVTALVFFVFLAHTAWNFYQQRNAEIARRQYERTLTHFSKRTALTAYMIEHKLGNLESLMKEFSAEAAARLEFPPRDKVPELVPFLVKDQKTHPAGAHYSPYYGHWLTVDHAAFCLAAKNVDEARAKREIAQLAPFMEKLVQRFLRSGSLLAAGEEKLSELKAEMLHDGNMMLWFYFASEAGFLLQYPGSDAMPENYDPRDRGWFKGGKAHPDSQVHWSSPYLGLQVKKLMMTCTQACRKDGKLLGVAGFDVILDRFREVMMQYGGEKEYVEARLLLDATGNVLVSCDGKGFPIWETNSGNIIHFQATPYASFFQGKTPETLNSAVTQIRQKNKLFIIFPVPKMNWFYAEVIHLGRVASASPVFEFSPKTPRMSGENLQKR